MSRGERWDRDRFLFERDGRDRYGGPDRYEDDYRRGPPTKLREHSVDDRYERRYSSKPAFEDDLVIRERRYRDDEPRFLRREPVEYDRQLVIEKEREREYRSPSPPPRPGLIRRQSSLDTFDRRPAKFYEREEYGPPARRGDFRPEPYVPIPLPRTRALPPPRRYAEREYYDEIKIAEPDHYGNDDYHALPERIREREIVRSRRRRDRSRESRGTSRHGGTVRSSSRSSTTTSSSSSSGTVTTVKSEYPKKGKTRIPARLVSKRALIDLGYPYEEEGNTVIVQKALGQDNIDDLLKLSEDYKKSELEVLAARSEAGRIVEERREEIYTIPPAQAPAPLPPPPMAAMPPPPPPPQSVYAQPPPPPPQQYQHQHQQQPVEFVETTQVYRDVSPSRASTTSYATSMSGTTHRTPVIIEAGPREVSNGFEVGPLALAGPRDERSIKQEIARLEAERSLLKREKRHHHSHSRHRSHSHSTERELVRAERLSSGELVLYEEKVEKIEEPKRGVRIEKDKKGRMSISVPKRR